MISNKNSIKITKVLKQAENPKVLSTGQAQQFGLDGTDSEVLLRI